LGLSNIQFPKYFENEPPYRYEKLYFEEGILDKEDVEKK